MSYKSPIEIIYGEMTHKLENEVFTAVQNIGINVDKDDTCFMDIKDTVEEVIALLKAKDTNVSTKWISVKDRLPEEWESAITFQPLLSGNFGLIRIGVYIGNNKWRECEMHNMMDLPVTHWMPLPKLPEEPKEEA